MSVNEPRTAPGSRLSLPCWAVYGSRRWKENIQTLDTALDPALDQVLKLRGVSFTWKETGKRDVGVIAIEAVKKQQARIDQLEHRLKVLARAEVSPLPE